MRWQDVVHVAIGWIIWLIGMVLVFAIVGEAHGQEPWLPAEAQKRDAELWAKTGVELPAGMKFYKVRRVSQKLQEDVNRGMENGIYAGDFTGGRLRIGNTIYDYPVITNTNDKPIWSAPGGLFWSDRSEWRNATAAFFPREVEVYRTMTPVKNRFGSYQENSVLRWTFPEGTIFADLLIRVREGREWPFELRIATKEKDKWNRVAHRPFADEADLPPGSKLVNWTVPALDEKLPTREYPAWSIPDVLPAGPFRPSRMVAVSERGGWLPRWYSGNVVACASCHDRAGESGDYAGVNAPGSDGVISWHPFGNDTLNTDAMPVVNEAWPARYVGWRGRNVDHLGRVVR